MKHSLHTFGECLLIIQACFHENSLLRNSDA
jgi:hypothetical protein